MNMAAKAMCALMHSYVCMTSQAGTAALAHRRQVAVAQQADGHGGKGEVRRIAHLPLRGAGRQDRRLQACR